MSEAQLLDRHVTEVGDTGLVLETAILPEQFADMLRGTEVSPEHRLMVAILEDAINCYLQRGGVIGLNRESKRAVLQWEAERWIFGVNDALLPFSSVCEVLNIDPCWLRKELEERSASGEPLRRTRQRVVPTKPEA